MCRWRPWRGAFLTVHKHAVGSRGLASGLHGTFSCPKCFQGRLMCTHIWRSTDCLPYHHLAWAHNQLLDSQGQSKLWDPTSCPDLPLVRRDPKGLQTPAWFPHGCAASPRPCPPSQRLKFPSC